MIKQLSFAFLTCWVIPSPLAAVLMEDCVMFSRKLSAALE